MAPGPRAQPGVSHLSRSRALPSPRPHSPPKGPARDILKELLKPSPYPPSFPRDLALRNSAHHNSSQENHRLLNESDDWIFPSAPQTESETYVQRPRNELTQEGCNSVSPQPGRLIGHPQVSRARRSPRTQETDRGQHCHALPQEDQRESVAKQTLLCSAEPHRSIERNVNKDAL